MRLPILSLFSACLLAFSASGAMAAAPAASTSTAPPALSPEQARHAAAVLQDPRQRQQALDTLRALAAASPAPAASAPPAPAAPAAASSAAAPAAGLVPLEANGLIAQVLRQVDSWSVGLAGQAGDLERELGNLPRLLAHAGTGAERSLLLRTGGLLLAAFAMGLLLEEALRRLLGGLRQALIAHADLLDAQLRARTAREAAADRPVPAQAAAGRDPAAAAAAGTRPPENDVALVQTHRDGVDRVEAVPVGPNQAAAPTGTPAAAATPPPPPPQARQPAQPEHHGAPPAEHWGRLRHLPFALAVLALDLLPLALFLAAAVLVSGWLAAEPRSENACRAFIGAYAATRLTMAILRLLIAPAGRGVRVVQVDHATATVLHAWLQRIVVVAAFGLAAADAARALGAGSDGPAMLVKVSSLLTHVGVVILIFRLRRPMARAIAPAKGAAGSLAAARNWLARAWAWFAAVLVMGVWVVWALGVEDGFPRLIHFLAVSAAILVAARLLAILLMGALGRLFHAGAAAAGADAGDHPARRYYPLAQRLLVAMIVAGTAVALLQAWGIDALGWFARSRVGHSLLSAVLTTVVAVLAAILVWETANAWTERRLDRWNRQGDYVRAARLRTLLPILRSCLFILIALVVALTALNQIGVNTGPLLAGASIVGVALGFGSQKLVQDFITGIFLLMENAMQVGDWVTVAGVSGTVEYLSIRTVRLRGGDGSLYIVPFSSVTTVNNVNRGLGNAAMQVNVAYDADVDRAMAELKQIGAGLREDKAFKDQILGDIEVWGVDAVNGAQVTLVGQIRCTDKGRWGVQRELNRRILERFRELGIAIANPQQMLLAPSNPVAAGSGDDSSRAGAPEDAPPPA